MTKAYTKNPFPPFFFFSHFEKIVISVRENQQIMLAKHILRGFFQRSITPKLLNEQVHVLMKKKKNTNKKTGVIISHLVDQYLIIYYN